MKKNIYVSENKNGIYICEAEKDGRYYNSFDTAIIAYPNAQDYIWHYDYKGIELISEGNDGIEVYKNFTKQIRKLMEV